MDEQSLLESVASKYQSDSFLGLNELYHLAMRDAMIPSDGGNRALEIGCGNGAWTPVLCDRYASVDVVEGSEKLLSELSAKCPSRNLITHHCLVEKLEPGDAEQWDHAFMTFLMEHLADPVEVLLKIRTLLTPEGSLFIAVPNANSLHRVIALRMGLMGSTTELSDNDRQVGHRRVYTRDTLLEHVGDAGFMVEREWAIGLKPFTLNQMAHLPEAVGIELANGGDLAPEHCAYLGLQATPAT